MVDRPVERGPPVGICFVRIHSRVEYLPDAIGSGTGGCDQGMEIEVRGVDVGTSLACLCITVPTEEFPDLGG